MKAYIHLANGFEEVEALTCVDVMRRAGIDAQMVSLGTELAVLGVHNIKLEADLMFEDADYSDCAMIVLPGGLPGATNLRDHEGLAREIKAFAAASGNASSSNEISSNAASSKSKKLAAICAAPLALAAHGALEGKLATIYPGMEGELKGGRASGENVTIDGDVITGIGPALSMEFALTLVEELLGKAARDEVAEDMLFNRHSVA